MNLRSRADAATALLVATCAVIDLAPHPAPASSGVPPPYSSLADTLIYAIDRFPEHVRRRDRLHFAVRIENRTKATISVPSHVGPGGGYVAITLLDPDGERVLFNDELSPEFRGSAQDIVRLKPGTFYGQLCTIGGMSKSGRYQLTLILYSPTAPSVPDMVRGDLASATVEFTVH